MEFREIPPVENEGARLVLITYVDGEGKSGQACAAQYAEENRIAVDCIISPGTFRSSFLEHERESGPIAGPCVANSSAFAR